MNGEVPTDQNAMKNIAELEADVGAQIEFLRCKILAGLDELMRAIRVSPLAFVASSDAQGQVDISPKGDKQISVGLY